VVLPPGVNVAIVNVMVVLMVFYSTSYFSKEKITQQMFFGTLSTFKKERMDDISTV
jgi:hypothetical protein